MGRPKLMNALFGDFQQEVMERFKRLLDGSPTWLPSESQARVMETLAKTQVILQKGKPLDEDSEPPNKRQRDELLTRLESATPQPHAADEDEDADAEDAA